MSDKLFGLKIKTYDWMSPDEFALVARGEAIAYENELTGEKKIIATNQPQIVVTKSVSPKAQSKSNNKEDV